MRRLDAWAWRRARLLTAGQTSSYKVLVGAIDGTKHLDLGANYATRLHGWGRGDSEKARGNAELGGSLMT